MLGEFYDKKIGNLMILDDSGIDHACCDSCFFLLFTGKSRQILAPSRTSCLLRDYKAVTAMLFKKNVTSKKTIFKV